MTEFKPYLERIQELHLPPRGRPDSPEARERIMALLRGLKMGTEEQLAELERKLKEKEAP